MRQNREIAKQCSDKSLRIKNLENELARIVAENVRLREDAINARVEADKWRASHRLNKEIVRMKDQLEDKLNEVNALVAELGALPEKVARRSSQRRRRDGFVSDLTRDPEEREPRPRPAHLDQEGRLPAILEDKQYPRKTLDALEVQRLADEAAIESLESPDLGPPPVAHFEEHEALTFNATRSPRRTSTELIEESEQIHKAENRRKRRISTLLPTPALEGPREEEPEVLLSEESAILRTENKHAPVATNGKKPATFNLKTGAKRKLEMSELEDTSRASKELDEFIFQRRTAPTATVSRPSRFSRPGRRPELEQATSIEARSPERNVEHARRVLAPKSTNSPAKRKVDVVSKAIEDGDSLPEKRTERRVVSRVRSRPAIAEISPPANEQMEDAADIIEVRQSEKQAELPPKSPAINLGEILSPVPTEPSAGRAPNELAAMHSVEDVLNGSIGRGSRRARAAVSYAPPKLNTKLRRPGKEMVGAVEGLAKITDQKSEQIRDPEITQLEEGTTQKNKKQERADAQDEKSEPGSPLIDKSTVARHRSSSGGEDLSKFVSRLSLYNPTASSPVTTESAETQVEVPKGGLIQRRHSTQQLSCKDTHQRTSSTGALRSRRANLPTPLEAGDISRHAKTASATIVLEQARSRNDIGGGRSGPSALTRRKSLMVEANL